MDKEEIDELRQRICDRFTSAEFVDIIDIDIDDLVECLWDQIWQTRLGLVLEALDGN